MNSQFNDFRNWDDPEGWLHELELTVQDPALGVFEVTEEATSSATWANITDNEEALDAAYRLALSLGHCILLKVNLPVEFQTVMLPNVAMAAGVALQQHLRVWTDAAKRLPEQWDAAPPSTADFLVLDILQARMDAWAAFTAISDAYYDCLIHLEASADEFGRIMEQLVAELNRFDEALRERETLAILSTVANSPVIHRWHDRYGVEAGETLPWWLDGTLNKTAGQIEGEVKVLFKELYAPVTRPVFVKHRAEWLYEIEWQSALAADVPASVPPIRHLLEWRSPDGQLIARLALPSRLPHGARIAVEFLKDHEPVSSLVGTPVWLCGVSTTIDVDGIARFDLNELRTKVDPTGLLILEVGPEKTEWLAQPE